MQRRRTRLASELRCDFFRFFPALFRRSITIPLVTINDDDDYNRNLYKWPKRYSVILHQWRRRNVEGGGAPRRVQKRQPIGLRVCNKTLRGVLGQSASRGVMG